LDSVVCPPGVSFLSLAAGARAYKHLGILNIRGPKRKQKAAVFTLYFFISGIIPDFSRFRR